MAQSTGLSTGSPTTSRTQSLCYWVGTNPVTRYELAAATAMVMMDTMDPVEEFVEDFFKSNGMEY